MSKLTLEQFTNFFKYYSEKPHQKEAIELYIILQYNKLFSYITTQTLKYHNFISKYYNNQYLFF